VTDKILASDVDDLKFATIVDFLEEKYPDGNAHFESLALTLRYIAQVMDEVVIEMQEEV